MRTSSIRARAPTRSVTFKKGGSRRRCCPITARKRSSEFFNRASSSARGASMARNGERQRWSRWRNAITSIAKSAMLATIDSEPEFSAFFMAHLLSRNTRIESDLIDQLFNSSERRLARLLLLLADFGKEGGKQPIAVNLSQEALAEMIGTTRSRVSFFMNKFRKMGFIDYKGKIEVHSSLLDAVLRDKPQINQDE